MVVLVDGVPQTLSLKGILQEFIKHRREVVKRRTLYDLTKAQEREHILLGLSKALDHIDEVIKVIKASKDVGEAEAVPSEAADEANAARITLRLPESLKSRVEAAAATTGVSVNTWLVQAAGRQLESRPHAGGSWRLTGYGRS